jgi:hypothetical protein
MFSKFGRNNMPSVRRISKDQICENSGKIIVKEGMKLFPDSDPVSYTRGAEKGSYQVVFLLHLSSFTDKIGR